MLGIKLGFETMKIICFIVLLIVVSISFDLAAPSYSVAAWGGNCKHSRDMNREVALGDATLIKVAAGAGKLKIVGAERAKVSIDARFCSDSKEQLEQMSVSHEMSGDMLEIETRFSRGDFRKKSWQSASIDLTLTVPNSVAMDVADSSGAAWLEGLLSLTMVDSSGELIIKNIAGDVDLTDSSGALTIQDVKGSVAVTDSSGAIDVKNVLNDLVVRVDSSGGIDARNIGGDVLVKRDSSGAIDVADVVGDFAVLKDSSGGICYDNVGGKVSLP